MADECNSANTEKTNKSVKAVQLLREVTMLLLDGKDTQQEGREMGLNFAREQPPQLGQVSQPAQQQNQQCQNQSVAHGQVGASKQLPVLSQLGQSNSNPHSQSTVQQQSQQFRNQNVAHGQVGAFNVLNNFHRIFTPYQRPPRVPLNSTFQPRYYKPLKPKAKQTGQFFQPKETWTHEFFCLAQKNQERVPSRVEKFELQECGLGRKKICFHSKAKYVDLRGKLEEEFPKLKTGGGFVLMRTGHKGSNSLLSMIAPPPAGYSVPFLRDCSGLGQALAYIRPLQRDLDKNPLPKVILNIYLD